MTFLQLLIVLIAHFEDMTSKRIRPLGYERVYLPLYKVADAPFHIQGDESCIQIAYK